MQGEQNHIVKQQIILDKKQFSSKQQTIHYYMSYDFPEKQRDVKAWWQEFIQYIIKKKNQIYITFKDLESITTINGFKPLPLKNLMNVFKKEYIFVREEDITLQKKPQKKAKSWFSNIMSFAWGTNDKYQPDYLFTFNPQEKIISVNAKQRKKKQLKSILQKQFAHQNSKFMLNLVKQLSWKLKINQTSVQILLKQLKVQKQLVIVEDENFGDHVLIYNIDRKKLTEQNYIKIEKIKCSLRGSLQRFDIAYEKSSAKIANLKQKAKDAVRNNDKIKAKVIVAQMKKQEDHRQKISVQKQVLQQKINQIQVNEMNKSSLQLLKQAQSAYQQVAVNQEKFQEVIQRAREIQMESDQNNKRFQQLAASDEIQYQVDDMMKEIEQEQSKKKIVQPKTVNVVTQDKPQKLIFEKAQESLNLN